MYNCAMIDRILGYPCVNLCVQSSIHVTSLSSFGFGENFRTFLTAQHIFHHFVFTTLHNIRKMRRFISPIFSLKEMYFKTKFA